MKVKKAISLITCIIMGSVLIVLTISQMAQAGAHLEANPINGRIGAWVDTIQLSTIPTASLAIDALEAGTIDFYSQATFDQVLYDRIQSNTNIVSYQSGGNYFELTINPAGPVFSGTGKLNPFDVPKIREAINWLIDRRHIVTSIYGDLAFDKFTVLETQQPEYARYHETIQDIEAYYAYDPTQAETVIASEMITLGAYTVGDLWYYNSEPVEIIFIIRTEDERTQIGDYVADQLESIGFTVNRLYKNSGDASAYWLNSDPDDGTWHLYTGGWGSHSLNREERFDFGDYYTPRGWDVPLWQAYTPSPAFDTVAGKLYDGDYLDTDERDQLFIDALNLSMQDSSRVWLVDTRYFNARNSNYTTAYNLVGGLASSDLWPYTIKSTVVEGGVVDIAQPAMLNVPWNPVGGTNALYDIFAQRATQDSGLVIDPNTGLKWPQRVESAEVYVKSGLVVTKTLDWLTMTFSDTIPVPDDAWVDWDVDNEVWITAGDKFTQTQYANVKSVVSYPSDLFTTTYWHDGSQISVADFVMAMILPFDLGTPGSPIYDSSLEDDLNNFLADFRGYRITSADPLVIEYYSDEHQLDAELMVNDLWPDYGRGEGAWHNIAPGWYAEGYELAFTEDKADDLSIPWMDFLTEPSLSWLSYWLDRPEEWGIIPYTNTLGSYVTLAEANARYDNLRNFYDMFGHFWIGTGPFYIQTYSHTLGTMTLQRFPLFADPAGRWDHFNHNPPATVEINYDTGAPGSAFNIMGTNYPVNSVAWISVNGTELGNTFSGPIGNFTVTLTTDPGAEEGIYIVDVSVNPSDFTKYELLSTEPTRPVEGSNETFAVPSDIPPRCYIYLPLVMR